MDFPPYFPLVSVNSAVPDAFRRTLSGERRGSTKQLERAPQFNSPAVWVAVVD